MNTALAWTLFVAVGAAVLFGMTPALQLSNNHLQEVLKDGGNGASAGKRHEHIRSALVVTEVALACVLWSNRLLLRSFSVLDVDVRD